MIKRSITENHKFRLEAQCEEAKTLQMSKIAASLEAQLKRASETRDDDSFYIYANADIQNDVNNILWDAITRISDFLGRVPDAVEIQPVIDKVAEQLFSEVCVAAHVPDGVGAYEPTIPGEARQNVAFEVDEG